MGRPDLAERVARVITARDAMVSQLRTYAAAQRHAAPAVAIAQPGSKTQPAGQPRRLEDLLRELDTLTGLAPVKAEVRQLINIVRVEQMRRAARLPVTPVSRHLVFAGNPG